MLTRSKLHPLSPEAIEARRALFGGYFMEDGADGSTGDNAGADDNAGDGTDADGTEGDDNSEDTNSTDPRVQRANRQAAQYRTQLRETQQQLQQLTEAQTANADTLAALRQALNPDAEAGDETDPTEVAAQATARVTELETENTSLRAQLMVFELAADNAGNPNALLDSRRFMDTLTGLDPAAEDYRDQVAEAIASAVASNTNLRADQGSPRGGSESAGGAGDNGSVTQEQFNAMGYKDRVALKQTNPTLYRQLADNAG